MNKKDRIKVCFIGGNQAGIIGILAAISKGSDILAAVSYSDNLTNMLKALNIPFYKSINHKDYVKALRCSDILLSVHGREIVRKGLIELPRYGAVNLHPYLYKYKGANPVERALKDREFKASVGAHLMSERVDEGKVLVEEFVDVTGSKSVEEVYNKLYPHYCSVTLKVLEKICGKKHKKKTIW